MALDMVDMALETAGIGLERAHGLDSVDTDTDRVTLGTDRAPLDASSTALNIKRYIRDTELNDISPSTAQTSAEESSENSNSRIARQSSFGLNAIREEPSRVESEDAAKEKGHNRNGSYQDRLKYLPNKAFNQSSNSIPNTFQYKNHPNAKTKSSLGKSLKRVASNESESDFQEKSHSTEQNSSQPIEPSQEHLLEQNIDVTPDWMPPELSTKWMPSKSHDQSIEGINDFGSSVRITKKPDTIPELSSNQQSSVNTIIHNLNTSYKTPMWKKAANQYESNKKSHLNLQNIFLDHDEKGDASDNRENHTVSSTLSTPYGTLNNNNIRNANEPNLSVNPTSSNPESPLKLFGAKYNTFTKEKLNDLLYKMKNKQYLKNTNSEEFEQRSFESPEVKMNIKNFTKSGSYTEEQFLQNANKLFNNIQKKGFRSLTVPLNNHLIEAKGSESNDANGSKRSVSDLTFDQTKSDFSSRSLDAPPESQDIKEKGFESMYTYDESEFLSDREESHEKSNAESNEESLESDNDDKKTSRNEEKVSPELLKINTRLDQLEALIRSMNLKIEHFDVYQAPQIDESTLTQEEAQKIIRWKKASRLKLERSNVLQDVNEGNINDANQPTKGHVKPDAHLPTEYENMVLDKENQRWIVNNGSFQGSLDDIDDLETENKSFESKAGVSFELPPEGSPKWNDVTRLSQVEELSFSQTKKRLVSIVTDVLSSELEWQDVDQISLAGFALENINELSKLLPNLLTIDLSSNKLQFLDGLPTSVMDLDISANLIDNITSFAQNRDLQRLNVSLNLLENARGLERNIHLTDLNLSNNRITTLDGISHLQNLIRLNVSSNDLMGEIDFNDFQFTNVEEVICTENRLSSVVGLEALPNLRILNLNENHLDNISCNGKHPHLKKLLLKFNRLRKLNLESYPLLRILRIDSNPLNVITNFKKLKYLQEISCKSQKSFHIIENVFEGTDSIRTMDISGNVHVNFLEYLNQCLKMPTRFINLSSLSLTAINLTDIPESFVKMFPNLTEINLNFNALKNILALSKLQNIRKLHLVSNSIIKTESIVTGVLGSRKSLKSLDIRLNPCTIGLYPYVFNPQELELAEVKTLDRSPIPLENADDIESFMIHYRSLGRSRDDWIERDSQFLQELTHLHDTHRISRRLNYETLLINFFPHLTKFDGGLITKERRMALRDRLRE